MITPFSYHRPEQLDEALGLLERFEDDVALYMGGTELLLLMKMGLAEPAHLVDGKRLAALRGIRVEAGELVVGAGVTHRELERDPIVALELPTLAELARQVANVRVRNVGTIGGNLCFGEPHSDPATLLLALDARVELASVRGRRSVRVADLYRGPLMTVLDADEIMVDVRIPILPSGAKLAYRRLKFRERPVANLAYVQHGEEVRVVVGALEALPRRFPAVEAALSAGPADLVSAVGLLRSSIEPQDDLDGSADFKRHLAGVLLERAVTGAA